MRNAAWRSTRPCSSFRPGCVSPRRTRGPELRAAFDSLAAVVAPFCADVDAATETFWAALHGLTELERSGPIRPTARVERVRQIVRAFVGSRKTSADHGL